MVVKLKENYEKTRHVKNNDKFKKYILRGERKTRYYEKFYLIKRNLIISIFSPIQHNCIISRQVVYKKAFDISRKGSHPHPTPTIRHQNHNITNHRVYFFFIISIQLFECYYLFLFIQLFQ